MHISISKYQNIKITNNMLNNIEKRISMPDMQKSAK